MAVSSHGPMRGIRLFESTTKKVITSPDRPRVDFQGTPRFTDNTRAVTIRQEGPLDDNATFLSRQQRDAGTPASELGTWISSRDIDLYTATRPTGTRRGVIPFDKTAPRNTSASIMDSTLARELCSVTLTKPLPVNNSVEIHHSMEGLAGASRLTEISHLDRSTPVWVGVDMEGRVAGRRWLGVMDADSGEPGELFTPGPSISKRAGAEALNMKSIECAYGRVASPFIPAPPELDEDPELNEVDYLDPGGPSFEISCGRRAPMYSIPKADLRSSDFRAPKLNKQQVYNPSAIYEVDRKPGKPRGLFWSPTKRTPRRAAHGQVHGAGSSMMTEVENDAPLRKKLVQLVDMSRTTGREAVFVGASGRGGRVAAAFRVMHRKGVVGESYAPQESPAPEPEGPPAFDLRQFGKRKRRWK
mmetsp:Transcript_62002/g.166132  ORF Transcript_62002/g.166132 Transcript_62002/m.166132 type:complete len:415 (+) Transcript_62002:54-1298(+)